MVTHSQMTNLHIHPFSQPEGWCRDVADPHLVQHGPPTRVSMPFGDDGWLITRYHDVRQVLSDRRFSSAMATGRDAPRVFAARRVRSTLLPTSDPPIHTRLRQPYSKAFGSDGAERWRPRVQQLADTLISQVLEAGPPADLNRQLFDPLGLQLLGEMMGVPAGDRGRVFEWSGALHSRSLPVEDYQRRINAASEYFDDIVQCRRDKPGTDVISEALRVRDARGDPTTDADIASMAAGLFATGAENLSGQLQIATHALLSHPPQLAKLRAQPELGQPDIEELMRYAVLIIGPLRARCLREDARVGGVQLHAGDLVLPSVTAANFDPDVFADPYRLDLSRPCPPTLTFGFGIHYCQAAQLTRMTMRVVLSALVRRLPTLRLNVPSEDLRWNAGRRHRSFVELPVSW